MATTSISRKIVGFSVKTANTPAPASPATPAAPAPALAVVPSPAFAIMGEDIMRPERIVGETYKVKSPLFEHALYVTINDIVLNEGTEFEVVRPFEVFINSKNMEQFQWIVALTRVMSAVFRKGGDLTFLVEELKAVFDPRGGYFKQGGVFMPSIVAELGNIVEQHLKGIGLMHAPELSKEQKALIAEKREALAEKVEANGADKRGPMAQAEVEAQFPPEATVCPKCSTRAAIRMDGCTTCLSCGFSKCG